MGIEIEAAGGHAGAEVGAILDMHRAIDAKLAALAGRGEIEVREALGRKRIASGGLQVAHVEDAFRVPLPARAGEVFGCGGDWKRSLFGAVVAVGSARGDAQAAKIERSAGEIERRLQIA